MRQTEIVRVLQEKQNSKSALLTEQLAKILNVSEDALKQVSKCWGYDYIFIKHPSNIWSIEKDEYLATALNAA